jgi:1-acyl-sn-glycerol-3-phosphate acyltransferase
VRVRALYTGFDQLVRRGLRGVWLRGELPQPPAIWAANHHSWWDGFLAAVVLAEAGRPAALLMDAENLAGYGFLRPLGVLPASRPRLALQALRENRVLVVFPEAELRTPGELAELAPGAGWLARRAPAPLVPVAVRVASRAHQYPEAYLDFGSPVEPAGLADALGRQLATLDAELARTPARQPPDGFRLLLDGRRSWDERIGGWQQRAAGWRRRANPDRAR